MLYYYLLDTTALNNDTKEVPHRACPKAALNKEEKGTTDVSSKLVVEHAQQRLKTK